MSTVSKKNNSRTTRSLSTTIAIAFLTLSIVVLAVSGGLQLYFNLQTQQQAISNQQQIIAENAAQTVGNFIERNFSILSNSVWLIHPNTLTPDAQTQILQSLLANQPAFRQFAFYDASGNKTTSTSRTQMAATKVITSYVTPDILSQTRKGQNYIGTVYFDVSNNEPLVLMAVPVINALGEFQGTLVGELNLISMWTLVDQLKVGNTGYAYVVDSLGKLIAFRDMSLALKGESVSTIKPVNDFIHNTASNPSVGASVYKGINGTTVVGTYFSLGSPKWAIVTELPWQEAYQKSIQIGAATLVIILALSGLAVAAGVWVARRLAIPLIKLADDVTAISIEDPQHRATVGGGREIEALANAFNSMTDQLQGLIGGLEERVAERTSDLEKRSRELQNAALIVREVSKIQDTDSLLNRVSTLIKEKFGYYHTGIFLIDDNEEFAVLKSASSEAGQLLLASNHKLRIGETGIVGNVAKTGEPHIALDTGADAVHLQNPLLPYTRSEMALPLKIGDRIIGVLDIQSDKTNAFDQSNISVMQIVTDQITIGIERSQFLHQMQQSAAELELTMQGNTLQSWRNFLEQKPGNRGYQYDGVTVEAISKPSDDITNVMREDKPVIIDKDEFGKAGKALAVPIRLRGQNLGILNLHFQSAEIPQETINVAEEASNRLALALENARLAAEAQQRAEQERMIGQVTAKMRQTLDIETILKTAVKEIRQTFGLKEAEVRLQHSQDANPIEVSNE